MSKDVRIFGYVICDITSTLRPLLEHLFQMYETPDGLGRYVYAKSVNMLIEVIPYQKLVTEAERRNMAYFKKLGVN